MSEKLESLLKTYTSRKERYFAKMQKMYDLSKLLRPDDTRYQDDFLVRYLDIEHLKSNYEDTLSAITEVQLKLDPDYKISYSDYEAFDDIYYNVKKVAKSWDDKEKSKITNRSEQCSTQPRLPKINLVSFDGNIEDWSMFHDIFYSLVHNNKCISDVDKFHYLLSCLKGQALSFAKSLPISNENYAIVWANLKKRYQDKRILVTKYLDKMLSMTPMGKESISNLSQFLEVFEHSMSAIKALEIADISDVIFCHLALRVLDPSTKKLFEMNNNQNIFPKFDDLITFVQNHVKVLQHSASTPHTSNVPSLLQKPIQNVKKYQIQNKNSLSSSSDMKNNKQSFVCKHCDVTGHMIYKCFKFRKLDVSQRKHRVRELNLCKNCLKDHKVENCTSKMSCIICKSNQHHYLLHSNSIDTAVSPETNRNVCYSSNNEVKYSVILGTAIVHVRGAEGQYFKFRAVLDSAAQSSFVTSRCADILGLPRQKCPFKISGLANREVKNHGLIHCQIKSHEQNSPVVNFDAAILPRITVNMPTVQIPNDVIEQYKFLKLADPNFYVKSEIDVLLAGDVFPYICDGQTIVFNDSIPCAMKTIFGYTILGKLKGVQTKNILLSSLLVSEKVQVEALESVLTKFWEIESVPPCKNNIEHPEDIQAETIFRDEHYRECDGRYVVPLIFNKNNFTDLGDSKSVALKRFLYLERRFSRSNELFTKYSNFMHEYQHLGHMQPIADDTETKYFISHHAIFKNSTTTPLRVVFDASAKSNLNISLNDLLLSGPKLQSDILDILINFRLFKYCFCSDISKMYRQILIDPKYHPFQHILWRNNLSEPIKTYSLKTVTYGVNCAPYLAIRTLLQLAHDEGDKHPQAAEIIKRGFYVDDMLCSVDSFDEACELQDQLIEIMQKGGFELKKWMSNCTDLLTRIPIDYIEQPYNIEGKGLGIKVLGMQWLPKSDSFIFVTNLKDNIFTKRSVLRLLASIYDPMGFVGPVIFVAKCLMQDLWKLGLDWDCSLPGKVKIKWEDYILQLNLLKELKIPRHILIPSTERCDLIAFCDASERGYGCVIYFISYDKDENCKVRLVISKSKVAPTKTMQLPRLELMACVLLSRMVNYVCSVVRKVSIGRKILLSDSTVALSWLQTPPYKLHTFVANRVVQVHESAPDGEWFHVRSEKNIADICSRGVMPKQFLDVQDWFSGPPWLQLSFSSWPISTLDVLSNLPETKENQLSSNYLVKTQINTQIDIPDLFDKYSSFTKLQRIVAWCLRFINRCRQNVSVCNTINLSLVELLNAREVIIKVIQQKHFHTEISLLAKGEAIKRSSLRKLFPFVCSRGFLRVGGRISKSLLSNASKYPILLPSDSHVTRLLVEHFHITYLHVGPRTLQGIISQTYWIVSARRVIRSVLSKCMKCFRCQPTKIQPSMATLPRERLTPGKVFQNVGCDVGGPFLLKESTRRNAKVSKAYLCLFVCFATKAVHLEVLSSLSSDCFLACMDRFVARRGLCETTMFTDNGLNYVGSHKRLNDVFKFLQNAENQSIINNELAKRQIRWKFNPPTGSHFGGLFEAGIKSAKYHLKRVIGDRALTYEELSTLFCRIEAVMNSRPLCPLSSDPNEYEVLTAGHFLVGQNLLSVPETDFTDVNINRLNRWQLLQKSLQHFWKRWQREYLHTLQQRSKWLTSIQNVRINDMVLVHSDQCHPYNWKLGRIEQVHPGSDGIVRVVTVRTAMGLFKRPVNKLSHLPYNC